MGTDTLTKIFFPRSVTKENGYHPRMPSNVAAIQSPNAFVSPELIQASIRMETHLTSLPGTPKSGSRERTPSPPPEFLRHAYTRSSSDIPRELERPPASSRRTTLPESVLHHFVRPLHFDYCSRYTDVGVYCRLRRLRHRLVSGGWVKAFPSEY